MIDADKMQNIRDKLQNWWEHGDQKSPCIIASSLKEGHSQIPDTDDLKKFWTDIEFRIACSLKIMENTNYYGQAVPYHWLDFMASSMCAALVLYDS